MLGSLGDAKGAERLQRASTSLATTSVYVTTEEKRRMKAMAKFWSKP